MSRRDGQTENNLVFNQRQHIYLTLRRQKIPGVVLDFFLRQIVLVVNEFQKALHMERKINPLQATLTTNGKHSVKLQNQLRPVALPPTTLNPILQTTHCFSEQIERTGQAGDGQFAFQRTGLPCKSQTVNGYPLRHKGRMVLFSDFKVKD